MNEKAETIEQSMDNRRVKENDAPIASPHSKARTSTVLTPQAGCATCGGSGGTTGLSPNGPGITSYVYAIGRVEARFPNLAAEKEFARANGHYRKN